VDCLDVRRRGALEIIGRHHRERELATLVRRHVRTAAQRGESREQSERASTHRNEL
jgi:hypothetical protein